MRDFLHGWRRKAGCVTLVIACVLCGMWVRSLGVSDFVEFNGRPWRYCVHSVIGNIRLIRTTPFTEYPFFDFITEEARNEFHVTILDNGTMELAPSRGVTFEWQFDWRGFHLSDGTFDRNSVPFRIQECVIPYWYLTIPLTLLSAYLILWKPRRGKAESDA